MRPQRVHELNIVLIISKKLKEKEFKERFLMKRILLILSVWLVKEFKRINLKHLTLVLAKKMIKQFKVLKK